MEIEAKYIRYDGRVETLIEKYPRKFNVLPNIGRRDIIKYYFFEKENLGTNLVMISQLNEDSPYFSKDAKDCNIMLSVFSPSKEKARSKIEEIIGIFKVETKEVPKDVLNTFKDFQSFLGGGYRK